MKIKWKCMSVIGKVSVIFPRVERMTYAETQEVMEEVWRSTWLKEYMPIAFF